MFHPVFPQTKENYSNSSLDELRNIVYLPYEGRAKRIKDMEDIHIKKLISKIRGNQIKETPNYSLPFLQLCLENELSFRVRRDNEIANKILFVFKNPYIRHIVRNYTINAN